MICVFVPPSPDRNTLPALWARRLVSLPSHIVCVHPQERDAAVVSPPNGMFLMLPPESADFIEQVYGDVVVDLSTCPGAVLLVEGDIYKLQTHKHGVWLPGFNE